MVLLKDFTQGCQEFEIRYWVARKGVKDFLGYKADTKLALAAALEAAGFDMPYPVKTLNVSKQDSGALAVN